MQQIKKDKLTLNSAQANVSQNISSIKDGIQINEAKINNLLSTLELSKDSMASKYIVNLINTVAQNVQDLKEKLCSKRYQFRYYGRYSHTLQ